mmetsp:Transcript_6899/g.16306  ORF Transcript_6899/g.16306 Transcript_6899/m.16306 type:complete len:252 (-) Transcript_6899:516-1271(-)
MPGRHEKPGRQEAVAAASSALAKARADAEQAKVALAKAVTEEATEVVTEVEAEAAIEVVIGVTEVVATQGMQAVAAPRGTQTVPFSNCRRMGERVRSPRISEPSRSLAGLLLAQLCTMVARTYGTMCHRVRTFVLPLKMCASRARMSATMRPLGGSRTPETAAAATRAVVERTAEPQAVEEELAELVRRTVKPTARGRAAQVAAPATPSAPRSARSSPPMRRASMFLTSPKPMRRLRRALLLETVVATVLL